VDRPPEIVARKEPHMIHEDLRLCGPQGQPCTRNCGIDCDWNTAETSRVASLAARANERIRQLEADKLALSNPGYSYTILDASEPPKALPMHVRVLDSVGNLPHRFGCWMDRMNLGRLFILSVAGVTAACLASVWLVGPK